MKIKVPLNDPSRVFLEHQVQILKTISDIASNGRWLQGEQTQKFAQAFAAFCGVEHCLPVANGTDALELALRAVLPEERTAAPEVITVANAGGYTTSACHLVGATPVYADIHESNQLIDIDSLIRCLGPEVQAVVITHLYGGAVDVPEVRRRLNAAGYGRLPIIEDCAQAHGAKVGEKRVGSLGDLAAFSFYPTKNLGAFGDAGAIVTSDSKLYERVKALSQYGWDEKYQVRVPHGRNSRMDEIQAGVLAYLLPHLDETNHRRLKIYEQYREVGRSRVTFLDYPPGRYVAHLAVALSPDREAFMKFMGEKGIQTAIHYPILDCDQPGWQRLPMRIEAQSRLKISRKSVNLGVSLPCFPAMGNHEIDLVCQALKDWTHA